VGVDLSGFESPLRHQEICFGRNPSGLRLLFFFILFARASIRANEKVSGGIMEHCIELTVYYCYV
jgi:hypothetical protein